MVLKNTFNVNKSKEKVDGFALACGQPVFCDDIKLKDMLYCKMLTSPHPHAIIQSIDTSAAEKMDGVEIVLCHKNVPRVAHTTAGQGAPEPSPYDTYMFDKKVRFVGDRVAAVAARSLEVAEEAVKKIKVKYKILPAVLDAEKAMDKGAPVIHDEKDSVWTIPAEPKRNIAAKIGFECGNMKKGLKDADVIVDEKYYSHYAQHCPIEPHISIAYIDENGRIVIRTSTQVPWHVRRIVAQTIQVPVKKIRVIKPRIGGGFGTKQEVLLEDIVALMALRTGKPVKLELTRKEEFISSRTRHPQIVWMRTSATKKGKITSQDLRIIMNTGAYGSHALTVACNSGSKVLPLYKTDNIKFGVNSVYTNLPVGGAYRGYGATQAYVGMEANIDMVCDLIGMDPVEFRKKNHIKVGDTSPVFKALGEGREGVEMKIKSCGLTECLDLGAKAIGWKTKRKKYKNQSGRYRKGIGVAAFMQGSSIPYIDMGSVFIKLNEDGSVNMLLGATDIGTGSDTIFAQIAAEVLGINHNDVLPYSSDTDLTPFDVGAYASSTTYLSGMAVIKAAEDLKGKILDIASRMLKEKKSNLYMQDKKIKSRKSKKSVLLSEIAMRSLYHEDLEQLVGVASHYTEASPPPFSAQFADIEVDTWTGKIRVIEYVAAVDCGTTINPRLAEGQVEGAVMNGLSFALTEEYVFDKNGRMKNPSFGTYKIFSAADIEKMKTIMVPTYEPTGPYGAKSVSEIGINGPIPVIGNAIYNAMGIRIFNPPYSPEKVLGAIEEADI